MHIAITGGSGFIGGVLTERLIAQGHTVRHLDIQPSERYPECFVACDVRDKAALMRSLEGIDVIYHLAAEHRDDVQPVQKYYDVNVGGAENVVAAVEHHGIQTIIFTSTVAVYGLDAGESKETDTPDPFNDYGASKLESEKVFEAWLSKDQERSLVTVRLVATFGPRNRGNIYNLMNQIASGRFVMVGDGKNKKSIAYVENVADFLCHCLSFGKGGHLYNYADKPDLDMNTFVGTVKQALGRKREGIRLPKFFGLFLGGMCDCVATVTGKTLPVSLIRVRKFCADTVVNADKTHASGFKPSKTLQDGIKNMIQSDFQK